MRSGIFCPQPTFADGGCDLHATVAAVNQVERTVLNWNSSTRLQATAHSDASTANWHLIVTSHQISLGATIASTRTAHAHRPQGHGFKSGAFSGTGQGQISRIQTGLHASTRPGINEPRQRRKISSFRACASQRIGKVLQTKPGERRQELF